MVPAKPALERAAHVRGLDLRNGSGKAQRNDALRDRSSEAVPLVGSNRIKD